MKISKHLKYYWLWSWNESFGRDFFVRRKMLVRRKSFVAENFSSAENISSDEFGRNRRAFFETRTDERTPKRFRPVSASDEPNKKPWPTDWPLSPEELTAFKLTLHWRACNTVHVFAAHRIDWIWVHIWGTFSNAFGCEYWASTSFSVANCRSCIRTSWL